MIIKYGKSCADIKKHKQKFFDDNEVLLKANEECAEIYRKQPRRFFCKTCMEPLENGITYKSHEVEYVICSKCGHVCGRNEETDAYNEYLYVDSKYGNYIYIADEESREHFDRRIKDIYVPKAQFLMEVLEKEGVSKKQIKVLDIGAGSGYFVSACDDMGISSYGIDMSKEQVVFGNTFLHSNNGSRLECIIGTELEDYIKGSNANIITAIGVMEHVTDYHKILRAIKDNKNIKYLYMSVPTFGFSNILESVMPNVYNRHLGGVHTHVFSQESINYLCERYDMELIAKWQFGTDMMDLYRSFITQSEPQMAPIIHKKLYRCLDEMQLILDKNDFCSEVHVVIKVNAE